MSGSNSSSQSSSVALGSATVSGVSPDRYKDGTPVLPEGPASVREQAIARLELTPEEHDRLKKRTLEAVDRNLEAKKVVPVTHQGTVTRELVYEDGPTQLKAADLASDMLGMKASRTFDPGHGVPVVFVFPNWFAPPTAQLRESADVVDVEAAPVTPDPAP